MKKRIHLDVEYASQALEKLPTKAYINKTICGCGFTTVALENNLNTIIAVPSVGLIENKTVQYPNDRCKHKIFSARGGVSKREILEYIETSKRSDVLKIMVTYDSLFKLEDLIEPYNFRLIIDESNKLLSTSRLKSTNKKSKEANDVTSEVLEIARKHKEITTFISATPTPLEYMPSWLSNELDEYIYTWGSTGKSQPILMERHFPFRALRHELILPIETDGFVNILHNKIKKLIIFLNSVNQIVSICSKANLSKEDVAIVCGDNVKNDLKIKGFSRLKNPKDLPKYTFVTSSGFEGIDLEDKEAISVVISNVNQNHQMIDMLTDLKQAISRQRIKDNPHYSKYIYIYNQSIFQYSKEELIEKIKANRRTIIKAIDVWEDIKNTDKREVFTLMNDNFSTYTSYNKELDTYIFNQMLYNSDRYFILEVREQYNKGFDISTLSGKGQEVLKSQVVKEMSYNDVVKHIINGNPIKEVRHLIEYMSIIKDSYKFYGKLFYNITYAKKMLSFYGDEFKQIMLEINKYFKKDETYLNKDVKKILASIYTKFGLNRTAKATDLQEFLSVKMKRTRQGRAVLILGNKNGFEAYGRAVEVPHEVRKELMYLIYPEKKKKHEKEAIKARKDEENSTVFIQK